MDHISNWNNAALATLAMTLGDETLLLFSATAPANPASESMSTVVRPQRGQRATFVAVFAPSRMGEESAVRRLLWTRVDGVAHELDIETASGTERWSIGADPSDVSLAAADRIAYVALYIVLSPAV